PPSSISLACASSSAENQTSSLDSAVSPASRSRARADSRSTTDTARGGSLSPATTQWYATPPLCRKLDFSIPTDSVPLVIITLAGIKGGTGKTTVAAALAAEAERRGARTLLVDATRRHELSAWAREGGFAGPVVNLHPDQETD